MDAWCNALASAAGLVRSYRAVISTSTVSVASRLTDLGPVYVVLPTGLLKVTESLSGLWGTSEPSGYSIAIGRWSGANFAEFLAVSF